MEVWAMLTSATAIAFIVPVLFLIIGAFGKQLIASRDKISQNDFHLGPEAALANIAAAITELLDVASQGNAVPAKQMGTYGLFLVLAFAIYMAVLSLHRWMEHNDQRPALRTFSLLGVSNLLGLGLMGLFAFYIKWEHA